MKNDRAFNKASITCTLIGIGLIATSFIKGKNEFFLLLNSNLGPAADFFFHYITYIGDGIIWVPISVWLLIYHRQKWKLLFAVIIISTALVNLGKYVIMPNEPRPYSAIADKAAIHTVQGVEVHTINSFPSGHTTTAFSVLLLLVLLTNNGAVFFVGFILALAAGYSRIYLAQHFPLDVGAGMITGCVSVLIAKYIQRKS
jgi:membrane-associated phospholipid phosphatase